MTEIHYVPWSVGILGIGLQLPWNGGSCGGISLKEMRQSHLKTFPALASVAN